MFPVNTGAEGDAKAAWTVAAEYDVPPITITVDVPDGARVKIPVFKTKHIMEPEVFHKARILAVELVLLISSVLVGVELLIPTNVFVPFSEWSRMTSLNQTGEAGDT